MVMALMNTEYFEFVAFADDETKAEKLMNKKFKQHIRERGVSWFENTKPTDYYGVKYFECKNNVAYRDGSTF